MRVSTPACRLLLAALAGLALAAPAWAQAPPLRLALELNARKTVRGDEVAAHSVARQVATHVTPQLEAQGWHVIRVFSARKAARSGRFHAAVQINVDARPQYHVHDAREYEDEAGRRVVLDYSRSVEAWGDWTTWDGDDGMRLLDGEILPILPQLQSAGAGRPELDDEASIARLLAEAAGKSVADALTYARAARP